MPREIWCSNAEHLEKHGVVQVFFERTDGYITYHHDNVVRKRDRRIAELEDVLRDAQAVIDHGKCPFVSGKIKYVLEKKGNE